MRKIIKDNINILYLDTETTGLPYQVLPTVYGKTLSANGYPRMVELAFVCDTPDGGSYKADMYPSHPDFRIPPRAMEIHHIGDDKGIEPVGSVLSIFLGLAEISDVIVGHNVMFDINVITGELLNLGLCEDAEMLCNMRIIDTMQESVDWCGIPSRPGHRSSGSGYKLPKLTELYQTLFGHSFEDAHNALGDVVATRECFRELVDKGVISL